MLSLMSSDPASPIAAASLDEKSIDALRLVAVDAVKKGKGVETTTGPLAGIRKS